MSELAAPGPAGRPSPRTERALIWGSGYSWQLVADDTAQSRAPLRVLGEAVYAAAAIAAANWAIAGYSAVASAIPEIRWGAAGAAAAIALVVVLILDRGTLFLADTLPRRRWPALVLWLSIRTAITVAISGLTAQALIPIIMNSDLRLQALQMQERFEKGRLEALANRFQITEHTTVAKEAVAAFQTAEQQAKTLPSAVQKSIASAQRCWLTYRSRQLSFMRAGMTEAEARSALRRDVARCAKIQRAADLKKNEWAARAAELVHDAEQRKEAAEHSLTRANQLVSAQADHARAIERDALNPRSSVVFEDLISKHPAAKLEWLSVTLVVLSLELLPIIMKLLMGKSVIGQRISLDQSIEATALDDRLQLAAYDSKVSRAISGSLQQSIIAACSDPATQGACSRAFAGKLRAFTPLEIASVLLRDVEHKQPDFERTMRRYPQYATAVSQLASEAVRDAVAAFTSEDPPRPRSRFASSESSENVQTTVSARAA